MRVNFSCYDRNHNFGNKFVVFIFILREWLRSLRTWNNIYTQTGPLHAAHLAAVDKEGDSTSIPHWW